MAYEHGERKEKINWKKRLEKLKSINWKKPFEGLIEICKYGNKNVVASACVMGLGQLMYKQWAKGIIYLLLEIGFIAFFALYGAKAIAGFFTLGTVEANPWYGVEGDNSVTMLIMGIFAFIILAVYLIIYWSNVKDVYRTQMRVDKNLPIIPFKKEIRRLFNEQFHVPALFLPILGVCIFCVLPIIFMILIAFTNYGGNIVPPALVEWVGFENFGRVVTLSQFAPTFFKILLWNFIWAIASTALNYFAGLGLALLYNRKCVKGKAFWRLFPILAYAVPGFITMLAFKFMFSYGGPINQIITKMGGSAVGFLDIDAKWPSRIIGLLVNCWLNIPSSMLLATGILSNMNTDLYEAARIDGASEFKQFTNITLPFVVFATTPVLISQFIGNFNNFGIFYFLRGGLYTDGYFLASDTDLLINWLYNLSIDNNYYSIGATISIIIFIITSIISLVVYMKSPSYKQEDTYK